MSLILLGHPLVAQLRGMVEQVFQKQLPGK